MQLRQKRENRRRRHYSLEEFAPDCDESSSSSGGGYSGGPVPLTTTTAATEKNLDLNPIKSFMLDEADLAEDALLCFSEAPPPTAAGRPSTAGYVEQHQQPPHLKERTSDFEASLLRFFDKCRDESNIAVEFPEGLLSIIVAHVVQEATNEPRGLKGCLLHIQYEGQTALHHLGSLQCDQESAPTFQVTLTLRQAQASWSQRMAR